MKCIPRSLFNFSPGARILLFAVSLVLAGCGGDSNPSTDSPDAPDAPPAQTISGTAAAGAAIIGQVTVKDAVGNTRSALIEVDGSYNVDVSGLTAPYRLRAEGMVGGRSYRLHSYAEAADIGGTVNITPFTDLIIANAAGQVAEDFFDANMDSGLDSALIDEQEAALRSRLQHVFAALGVSAAIDLLNGSFQADHSGVDAALDIVRVEVDSATNIATIRNLIENTLITDNLIDPMDNADALPVNDVDLINASVGEVQAVALLVDTFNSLYISGLPAAADLEDLFGNEFLQGDTGKSQFITLLSTEPAFIGWQFTGLVVDDLDDVEGTATITFRVDLAQRQESAFDTEIWYVARDLDNHWQFLGNKRIVQIDGLTFNCGHDNESPQGGCGLWVSVFDSDFSNNNTAGAPIMSATATLIDGSTQLTKATIYLGNPATASAGELQIYNISNDGFSDGYYSRDYREFGDGLNDIDPSLFASGDIIEYRIYTQALDISSPDNPSVAVGTEIAIYSQVLPYAPSLIPLYPVVTETSLESIQNFELGKDIFVEWILADGTSIDQVDIEIWDDMGNSIEVYKEPNASSDNSINVSASELGLSAEAAGLDLNAATYSLEVRVEARDLLTGQSHLTATIVTIPGPAVNSPSINGAFAFKDHHPGFLVFYPNGFYIQWQDASHDPNCGEDNGVGGVEYGTYSYDGDNFLANPVADENASCGLTDWDRSAAPLTVEDTHLTYIHSEEGPVVLARTDGGPDSIIGAWKYDTDADFDNPGALVFYEDGAYMYYGGHDRGPECNGGGAEYGTYVLNGTDLEITTQFDQAGECGLSVNGVGDFTLPGTSVNGDNLSVFGLSIPRVGAP